MTLTQLSYIVSVAEHRNFGAAANASHVSQPTLSMQIQKLEDELGVMIFNRSQQPIQLTAIGVRIIEQARIVLVEAKALESLTIDETSTVKGAISLGVIPTLSPYIIPLFIEKFIKRHPEVSVTIEELQTEQILGRLKAESLDIGLLVTPLNDPSIIEVSLFYEPFSVYASKKHKLFDERKVRLKDLTLKNAWLLTEGHCFRDQVLNLCANRSAKGSTSGNLQFESGNLDTLRKMVDQGDGYTFLPLLAALDIQDPIRRKQLREFEAPVPIREVSLIHSKMYKKNAVVEALKKEILEALPKNVGLQLAQGKKSEFTRVAMPSFKQ